MILAIDPGLRWCGVAIGDKSGLKAAALVLNMETKARGPVAWREMAWCVGDWYNGCSETATEIHVEVPRYYPRQRYVEDDKNVDPNDLMELTGVVGAVVSELGSLKLVHYLPSDWKGQVPKKIMTERIRKKLRPEELDNMISVGARDHNTLDAVGIFLHSVGRL